MVDWKYMLLAQFPSFFIMAAYFLIRHLMVRKTSAVKSILWVLLFGVTLSVSVLCLFLGVHYHYWTLLTLFPLGFASWIGIILIVVSIAARVVHVWEKKRSQEKLEQAEREKEAALAQAEEAKREAQERSQMESLFSSAPPAEPTELPEPAEAAEPSVEAPPAPPENETNDFNFF